MRRVRPAILAVAFAAALHAAGCGGGSSGSSTAPSGPTGTTGTTGAGALQASIILGSPTSSGVKLSVLALQQSGTVSVQHGISSGTYGQETEPVPLLPGVPAVVSLTGLPADTRIHYRLWFRSADGVGSGPMEEHTFHTARPPGSTFTFTVQADSHLDENSDLDLYRRALGNVVADAPDFHVDLGDTFMCEKHAEPLSAFSLPARTRAEVDARYAYERANFGIVGPSAPIFLVNGNHEGEAGWAADGTGENLAIWSTQARQRYFLNPVPDGFYGGDGVDEPFVGRRASWYAWTWGDALFVVLDPFWNSRTPANKDAWAITLGERQYRWLEQTLASSTAQYKLVFVHNLVGGLDGQMRGGVEAAPYHEWGGRNADGSDGFAARRPGWGLPIHPLLVRHGVAAVFHGHDHLYARQELDGIVYLEVPQPSARNTQSGPQLAADYHYATGTILSSAGHVRVTVGPSGLTARYVRAWLPASENASRQNGQVDDTWTVAAPAAGAVRVGAAGAVGAVRRAP